MSSENEIVAACPTCGSAVWGEAEVARLRAIVENNMKSENAIEEVTMKSENAIEEVTRLAVSLEAIGRWQQDQVYSQTPTSSLFLDSAKWLRKIVTIGRLCGAGVIGCGNGPDCDFDHK